MSTNVAADSVRIRSSNLGTFRYWNGWFRRQPISDRHDNRAHLRRHPRGAGIDHVEIAEGVPAAVQIDEARQRADPIRWSVDPYRHVGAFR